MGADTAVRGIAMANFPLMHADAGFGESHPIGHTCTQEFASGGDYVYAGIGFDFDDVAIGVEDLSVEIRAFVFELFGDAEVSGWSFMGRTTSGNPVIHGNIIID